MASELSTIQCLKKWDCVKSFCQYNVTFCKNADLVPNFRVAMMGMEQVIALHSEILLDRGTTFFAPLLLGAGGIIWLGLGAVA